MFASGNFWDESPQDYLKKRFLKILKLYEIVLLIRVISKFLKMHSGILSQIAIPNM